MITDKAIIKNNKAKQVDNFINNNYEFRCNPRYKGFFGKILAYSDRLDIEEQEKRYLVERYQQPLILYSDPVSDEEHRKNIERALETAFSPTLLRLMEHKGKNHIDVYKRANIDRKLFSKISNNKDYIPSKRTVIAFAIALELSLDETNSLLKRAGYALSNSILFDVIVSYFIMNGEYDFFVINEILFIYKQPIFG